MTLARKPGQIPAHPASRVDVRYQASQSWPFPAGLMIGYRARAAETRTDSVEQFLLDTWLGENR